MSQVVWCRDFHVRVIATIHEDILPPQTYSIRTRQIEFNIMPEKTNRGSRSATGLQGAPSREEQVRLVLDSTAEGAYAIDLQGKLHAVQPCLRTLLGYGIPADVREKTCMQLSTIRDRTACRILVRECRIYQSFRKAAIC